MTPVRRIVPPGSASGGPQALPPKRGDPRAPRCLWSPARRPHTCLQGDPPEMGTAVGV